MDIVIYFWQRVCLYVLGFPKYPSPSFSVLLKTGVIKRLTVLICVHTSESEIFCKTQMQLNHVIQISIVYIVEGINNWTPWNVRPFDKCNVC